MEKICAYDGMNYALPNFIRIKLLENIFVLKTRVEMEQIKWNCIIERSLKRKIWHPWISLKIKMNLPYSMFAGI
jgi:hypothetical protein